MNPESPLTVEDGYLRMNIGSPTRSVLFSPTSEPLAFQFPSTAKLSPTDKQKAQVGELKPMLKITPNYNNLPNNSHQEDSTNQSSAYTNVPIINNSIDDDRFGDGLRTNVVSPSFENPSYQMLGHDEGVGRKRGYSEASSSGFHSERDSLGHSPKQDDDSRASPPHYQEATQMTNSVLV